MDDTESESDINPDQVPENVQSDKSQNTVIAGQR